MIIDAYNTTQDVRGRSDYLSGARPGQAPPPYVPFDPRRILDRMDRPFNVERGHGVLARAADRE